MLLYELTHIFYRSDGAVILSPKGLGLYSSRESIQKAMEYYKIQPGFCDNLDAFSVKERTVDGAYVDNIIYEVIVYLHTEDYEFEADIELGLYGDEATARNKLTQYCKDNEVLLKAKSLIAEKIINRCEIDRREWSEGFSVS